jgi:hemerythrin
MAFSPNVIGVRFHVQDLDDAFPEFLRKLSELHDLVSRHEEGHLIEAKLDEVIALCVAIFRREEEAMDITRDRMSLPHRAAHQKFLKSLSKVRRGLGDEGPSIGLAMDLKKDVMDWMGEHHLLMDASLGRHIRGVVDRSIGSQAG